MKKPIPLPPIELLNEFFLYDENTGKLTNKYTRNSGAIKGEESGGIHARGYRTVKVKGISYKVHRIIWKLMTGTDPIQVDHINGNPSDNRWENLRECTQQQNTYNKKLYINNKTGVKGIYKTKNNKYSVRVSVNKQRINVGTFDTLEEAEQAYKKFVDEHHGEFANYG